MAHEAHKTGSTFKIYHLVIPSRGGDHMLAREVWDDVFQLPTVDVPLSLYSPNTVGPRGEEVTRTIGLGLGLDVHYVVDFCISRRDQGSEGADMPEHYICVMNLCEESPVLPDSLQWIHRTVLLRPKWLQWLKIYGREEEAVINDEIQRVFHEMNSKELWETNMVQPWFHAAWYYLTTSWINDALQSKLMIRQGPILETWCNAENLVMTCRVKTRIGRTLKCDESSGELIYIKAVCPVLHEGQRTAAIARVVGDLVPEVIAVHERGGLMIQRDGGSITDDPLDQETLINTIATMQRISMNHVRELETGGLKVITSEWLAENIEAILQHEAFRDKRNLFTSEGYDDLAFKERLEQLRSGVGLLQKLFRKIASLRLPKTLVHGDLALRNVGSKRIGGGKLYCFFDWAKSFVGHPLYDFVCLLSDARGEIPFPEKPQHIINYETALPHISKLWMPSATRYEVESVFHVTQVMRQAVEIYHLTEQYDTLEHGENYHIIRELKGAVWLMQHFFINLVQDREEALIS